MLTLESYTAALARLKPRHRRIVIACAVLAVMAYFMAYLWPTAEQPMPQPAKTRQAGTVFGPGKWVDSSTAGRSEAGDAAQPGITPPGGLTVSADQQLQIDTALLNVIDFYLLEHAGPDSEPALHRYLKSHLPAPAYGEAEQIVSRYEIYMKAHDALLASQNINMQGASLRSLDLDRMQTWLEQRNRLRQATLGDRIVAAWYRGDDEELNEALEQARRRNGQSFPQQSSGQETEPSLPARSASDNAELERDILEVLDRATQSYASLARQRTSRN